MIIEESGIAKGIRRIVAVTGHDAHHVQKVANEFEQEIDNASSLPFGVAKESKSKELGVALKKLSISVLDKQRLTENSINWINPLKII